MHRIVASWFGSGLLLRRFTGSDAGSGTLGAAVALAMSLGLGRVGWWAQAAAIVVVTGLSIWSSGPFAHGTDDHDPGWVVADEAAGAFVATFGLGVPAVFVAWVVFRLADIFKGYFPGVAAAERLPGGWGITADDLVAGLYGAAAGWAVTAFV
ncbi:MAG TPA: phosphatidylglycerophosphatase A [Acidimicrobiia bacterium]|nr:phosphatidylglycerophosphatase A [Acidimicrobiia bacterium]